MEIKRDDYLNKLIRRDEHGIVTRGIREFLLDPNSLES